MVFTERLKPSKKLQKLSKQKLYNLADLAQIKTWNYELPTITKGAGFTSRQHWQKNSTFWKNFSSNHMFKHPDHESRPGHYALDTSKVHPWCILVIFPGNSHKSAIHQIDISKWYITVIYQNYENRRVLVKKPSFRWFMSF